MRTGRLRITVIGAVLGVILALTAVAGQGSGPAFAQDAEKPRIEVKVAKHIVKDSGCTKETLEAWFAEANRIWASDNIVFVQDAEPDEVDAVGDGKVAGAINIYCSDLAGTATGNPGRAWDQSQIEVGKDAPNDTLAHELGHWMGATPDTTASDDNHGDRIYDDPDTKEGYQGRDTDGDGDHDADDTDNVMYPGKKRTGTTVDDTQSNTARVSITAWKAAQAAIERGAGAEGEDDADDCLGGCPVPQADIGTVRAGFNRTTVSVDQQTGVVTATEAEAVAAALVMHVDTNAATLNLSTVSGGTATFDVTVTVDEDLAAHDQFGRQKGNQVTATVGQRDPETGLRPITLQGASGSRFDPVTGTVNDEGSVMVLTTGTYAGFTTQVRVGGTITGTEVQLVWAFGEDGTLPEGQPIIHSVSGSAVTPVPTLLSVPSTALGFGIDADNNPNTGDPRDGSDYRISVFVADRTYAYEVWNQPLAGFVTEASGSTSEADPCGFTAEVDGGAINGSTEWLNEDDDVDPEPIGCTFSLPAILIGAGAEGATISLSPFTATLTGNVIDAVLDTGPRLTFSNLAMEAGFGPVAAGFSGTVPAAGQIGLLGVSGEPTADELVTDLTAAGCEPESLAILVASVWNIFIPRAPTVVNAAFPATVTEPAFFVRC